MDFYPLLKPLLFKLDPEKAHHLTLAILKKAQEVDVARLFTPRGAFSQPVNVMGLTFPNRVGLAAGMDKTGECVAAFGALGFGFVEVGTLTPKPQDGNPKPRLFRLPPANAIINRMGFNNPGIEQGVANVNDSREGFPGIVGINIGKNAVTPIENAVDDYVKCLKVAYPHADYIAANLSSPNTKNLRDLQNESNARVLFSRLKEEQTQLADQHGKYVPLVIKIAPDLLDDEVKMLAGLFAETGIDGVIATNTTISREAVKGMQHAEEAGGLSGTPVTESSLKVIQTLHANLPADIPIIGVGGIMNGNDATAKLDAGASLVQIYTGLVYRGAELIKEILKVTRKIAPAGN
jgi:dihydroorotate dehydrogenase